jgi:hypothetical protein
MPHILFFGVGRLVSCMTWTKLMIPPRYQWIEIVARPNTGQQTAGREVWHDRRCTGLALRCPQPMLVLLQCLSETVP